MINLSGGDLEASPLKNKLLNKAISKLKPLDLLTYPNTSGLPKLKTRIEKLFFKENTCKDTIITGSATEALSILNAYFDIDEMAIQTPYYFGIGRQTKTKQPHLWESIFDLKNIILKNKITSIYLTSNFHSVTTASFNKQEKNEIIKLAQENDIWVIEDNPNDLLCKGKVPTNITDEYNKGIYVGSLSKVVAPGLRLGFIHANKQMITNLKSQKITNNLSTSNASQIIANYMLKDKVLKKTIHEYKYKLKSTEKELKELNIKYEPIKGGIFINIPITKDLVDTIQLLKTKGVEVEENKFSYPDKKNRNVIKINFLRNSINQNKTALKKIKKCL